MTAPLERVLFAPGGASEVKQNAILSSLADLLAELQKKLAEGGIVTVANPTADPETGLSTEATLATRATEATLATRATEATLATRATEATLASAVAALTAIDAAISTSSQQSGDDLTDIEVVMTAIRDLLTDVTTGAKSATVDVTNTTFPLTEEQVDRLTPSSRFTRLLKFEPSPGEEIRRDETADYDYHGAAPDGTPTASTLWDQVRFTKVAGKIVRVQFRSGAAWDDRATGWT